MVNDLKIIEKINNKLSSKIEKSVFPLSPTHRKELRQLKKAYIGNLYNRLTTLKSLKFEEYLISHKTDYDKLYKSSIIICQKLNKKSLDFNKLIESIIRKAISFENSLNLSGIKIDSNYSLISKNNLEQYTNKEYLKIYTINEGSIKNFMREKFDEKYKDSFIQVSKIIEDLENKYEEAINFGDLELVRQLYYTLKDSDLFFEKIANLKV